MRHVFSKSLSILLIVAVSLLFVSCSKKTSSVNNSSNYDYELSEEHIVTDDETGLQYVNNILIVYFKDSASDSDVSSVVSDVNGKIVGQYSESNQIQIEVPVKDMSELESLCDSLMERDYVDYCTYDYVYQNDAKELIPNDTWDNYSSNWSKRDSTANWGQIAVEAPAAWALCSNNTSETVVGVVDSGIDVHHEDFEGKVSSVSDNSIPEEHGTHVTGIIGAVGNNHIGIAGMDWKAKILGYDCFLGQEKTSSIKILNGLETVVRNGAKVINLSIGSSNNWESHKVDIPRSAYYRQAEDASRTLGRLLKEGFDFIVVQSAGNGAKDYIGIDAYFNGHFCSVDKETCFKGYGNMDDILNRIIIVGNAELSGNEFRQSISSNGGSQVSIYAPGTSILSSIENNNYKLLSGTSMAAPFVTGIASLVWSENPDLNGAEVKRAICDDSNTVYSVANNPGNASYGEGRMVNAYRAVKSVSNDKSDEWKKAYINYILHGDGGNKSSGNYDEPWDEYTYYQLIDVDGDEVPELLRTGGFVAQGEALLTYANGKLIIIDSYVSSYFFEGNSGYLWRSERDRTNDIQYYRYFEFNEGKMTELKEAAEIDPTAVREAKYIWDGKVVTQEEFDKLRNNEIYSIRNTNVYTEELLQEDMLVAINDF